MRTRKLIPLRLSLVALFAFSPGCKGKDGKGTENPEDGAADEDPVAKLEGMSAEITGELDAVMKPITDAEALINEVGALPERLGMTMGDLKGLFEASFNNGEVAIAADLDITAEARAELEVILNKAKEIGEGLRALPETVKTSGAHIAEVGVKATGVATAATTKLTAKLSNPLIKADAKASIEADIAKIDELKANIGASVQGAQASVMELPAKATEISAKLLASFAGSASAG